MQVPAKSIWASKTFWTGVAVVLLAGLEALTGLLEMSGDTYAAVLGVVGVVMMVLRYVTKQPVTVSGKETKTVLPILLLLMLPLMACGGGDDVDDDHREGGVQIDTTYDPRAPLEPAGDGDDGR